MTTTGLRSLQQRIRVSADQKAMHSFDPRVVAHIDILTDVAYARLVSSARQRGVEVPAIPTNSLKPGTLARLRLAHAEVLADLLDRD